MLRFVRRNLSYANVMATVAVFIALGGTAAAVKVTLKANQVKAKNIKAGAVTEPKLANNAVTGAKIKDGAVGIAEAGNSLHQTCPSGTTYQQGGCLENASRSAADWNTARTTCYGVAARLPDTAEMATFFARGGSVAGSGEWTTDLADGTPLATRFDSGGGLTPSGLAVPNPFRCVHQPLG
jgi:hypothetical protein